MANHIFLGRPSESIKRWIKEHKPVPKVNPELCFTAVSDNA